MKGNKYYKEYHLLVCFSRKCCEIGVETQLERGDHYWAVRCRCLSRKHIVSLLPPPHNKCILRGIVTLISDCFE